MESPSSSIGQSSFTDGRKEIVFHEPDPARRYEYTPLELGQVRLLRVHPGEPDGPIEITLFTVNLEEYRQGFMALSYTWGTPDPPKLIYVNPVFTIYSVSKGLATQIPTGKTLVITSNLYGFLVKERATERDGIAVFWIDQISINQSDLEEKSRQVTMMGEIYASAALTIVWLGTGIAEDTAILGHIVEFFKHADEFLYKFQNMKKSQHVEREENKMDEKHPICEIPDQALDAFIRFISSHYFRRIWIIQELIKSPQSCLMVGRILWPWEKFLQVFAPFHALMIMDAHSKEQSELSWATGNDILSLHDAISAIYFLYKWIRDETPVEDGSEMLGILWLRSITSKSLATDPRDYVYAITGLLTNPKRCVPYDLVPD
jgi:hypothetical protein